MKTPEEVLNAIIGEVRSEQKAEVWYDDAIQAMQEYAKQYAKSLLPTDESIDSSAENYAFRVPYDGSNEFYNEEALKHYPQGMMDLKQQILNKLKS